VLARVLITLAVPTGRGPTRRGRGCRESLVEREAGFEGAAHRAGLGDLLQALDLIPGEMVGEVDGDLDPSRCRVGVVLDIDAQIAEIQVPGTFL
jgi:hypothetical protein